MVDHALARFSTDNLSVMVVRFDPKKLQSNTSMDIGVEDTAKEKGISEAEMIVSEARRHSGLVPVESAVSDSDDLREQVIKEHEDEQQEPGPELTPEGQSEAEKILQEKQKGNSQQRGLFLC